MIRKKTVLILGAGASKNAGYPLGSTLVEQICDFERESFLDELPGGWTKPFAIKMLQRLRNSDMSSIDAFLEINDEYIQLGKFFITKALKQFETANLLPSMRKSWYHVLAEALLSENGPRLLDANLTIVTFNYDRSLEFYLHTVLCNRFGLESHECANILKDLKILHVHGMMGAYPDVPYSASATSEELLTISTQIQIIHEFEDTEGHFCNTEFDLAHHALLDAKRIYFLGFGFHEDNIRRLEFFGRAPLDGIEILSTTYGMRPVAKSQLSARLRRLNVNDHIVNYAPDVDCNLFFDTYCGLD